MSWIEDIQGLTTVLDENDAPVQRRSVVKFEGATVADDGTKTVVTIAGGAGAGISGRLVKYTEYATPGSGTHIYDPTGRLRIIHLQGAGAGAGGVTSGAVRASAGAQAGGWKEIIDMGAPTGTGAYIVGAAGVQGNAGTPTNGTDGGLTSLNMNGGVQSVNGGVGSDTINSGGGVVIVNLPRSQSALAGPPGGPGLMLSATVGVGGPGGSSRYGKGGEAKSGLGASGVGAGSGGSGAFGSAGFNGGNGTPGLIRIWEFS